MSSTKRPGDLNIRRKEDLGSGEYGVEDGNPLPGLFDIMKCKMEGITGDWYMMLGPVMRCEGLTIQEKCLLSCVMSLKNSMDNAFTSDDKIMGLTGLSQEELNTAFKGLLEKGLVFRDKRELYVSPMAINEFFGRTIYQFTE